MIVKKGGITRNIDENRLHEYKSKGYTPVEALPVEPPAPPADEGAGEKPIERMTTAELTQKAAELGLDISGATTNKQRAEAILAHLAEQAKE